MKSIRHTWLWSRASALKSRLRRYRATRRCDQQLYALDPRLDRLRTDWTSDQELLSDEFQRYTTAVSPANHAVSLQCASFLRVLCDRLKATHVIDFGSGFSSYALRRYAQRQSSVTVTSVDDSETWLDRTRAYLRQAELNEDRLVVWDEFVTTPPGAANLIFYDLGFMSTRKAHLEWIVRFARDRHALLVLDDVHKPHYREFVNVVISDHQPHVIDVSPYTLDEFGRYSIVMHWKE